ncbi:hypothetical protein CHCC20375_0230 [Bacillus licheniformis]|nr:hypothetical protein CHCC20375_0230 [Bacillus licheniformis]TWK52321.1 hypothetical protein CHCC20344_0073 [Bacillus licheniformis]TWL80235.1 hypothetical protein CHCC15315_0383 [Bacillus licheniformis]TWM57735.1 hypothetical protein CHCC14813_3584 [Bacillus licheniformis]
MKGSSKMQGPLSITDPIGSTHFQHDFCKYAPCFVLGFQLELLYDEFIPMRKLAYADASFEKTAANTT